VTDRHRDKRERLFSLYASNLSIYFPEVTDRFLCPICLTLFTRDALTSDPPDVALAHVVPKSLKGQLCTLACRKCDNKIGSAFDSHVAREKQLHNWEQGATAVSGRLKHNSGDIGVEIRRNGNTLEFWDDPRRSPPKSWERFLEVAASDWPNTTFSFTVLTYSPMKRDVSLLYSAFLMMFYYFGYEYVLSPNVDRVRQVILGNDTSLDWRKGIFPIPKCQSETMSSLPSVSILLEPGDIRSFLVALPSPKEDEAARCVLLPGFEDKGKEAYDRILSLTQLSGNFKATLIPGNPSCQLASREYKWFGNLLWKNVA